MAFWNGPNPCLTKMGKLPVEAGKYYLYVGRHARVTGKVCVPSEQTAPGKWRVSFPELVKKDEETLVAAVVREDDIRELCAPVCHGDPETGKQTICDHGDDNCPHALPENHGMCPFLGALCMADHFAPTDATPDDPRWDRKAIMRAGTPDLKKWVGDSDSAATKLYADGTDWDAEFSHIGAVFYTTVEDCVASHPCSDGCGVVEVEVEVDLVPPLDIGKNGGECCYINPNTFQGHVRFLRWAKEPTAEHLLDSEGRPASYGTDSEEFRDDLDTYRLGDGSGVVERHDAEMRWGTAVEEDEGPTENEKWLGFCCGEYPEEEMAEAAIGAIIEEFDRLYGGPDNCPYGARLDREDKTVVLWKNIRYPTEAAAEAAANELKAMAVDIISRAAKADRTR